MTMNPLPPQAYTKETLLKAYHWLQQQPSHIKEMAMTPDVLVSLYLKASRDGDGALDRPSIQNFKAELKNLAGMIGELEGPKPVAPPSSAMPASSVAASAQPAATTVAAKPAPAAQAVATAPVFSPAEPPMAFNGSLDAKSLEMLGEIRQDFNLSSDTEALRMLIKIGYTKAKGFFGHS